MTSLDEVNRVNLHSTVMLVQAALPNMQAKGWGRIVNVSSLTVLGAIERTVYAGAKAALISFARTWALELAAHGITSNVVAPGPTETAIQFLLSEDASFITGRTLFVDGGSSSGNH